MSTLPSSGPSTDTVLALGPGQDPRPVPDIKVVNVGQDTVEGLKRQRSEQSFGSAFTASTIPPIRLAIGDLIDVALWEAPPAMLFGTALLDPRAIQTNAPMVQLPAQTVDIDGTITVPFAGRIRAAGLRPHQVEDAIRSRLKSRTNQVQALVRVSGNLSAAATVVGEVQHSQRLALGPQGYRVLDAIAAAGGVRQPVHKTTLQLSRGRTTRSMPFSLVLTEPQQNVLLQPGDVITVLHQSHSFTVLGATGRNEEVPFEATGITLAQGLARSGGLQDARAHATGLFVFRFEARQEDTGTGAGFDAVAGTGAGRETQPVVYQFDLSQASGYFLAKQFDLRDGDLLFASNAPAADFEKFLRLVSTAVTPVIWTNTLIRR